MPVPCFLLFLVSESYFWKYSRNCTKQKARSLFFQHVHGVRRRDEGEHRGGQTTPRRGWAPCRACLWFGPLGGPLTSPLRLFIPSDAKTLKYQANFHEEFRSAAAIDDKFRGTESLFRHAAGTGNCPRSHLHRHHRHLHHRC